MTTTLSLIINIAKTPRIHGISDMKEAVVGVQAATTDYDAAVMMRKDGQIGSVKVYAFDRIDEAINDLTAGHITAVMKVYPVAAWLAGRTPTCASWRRFLTTLSRWESDSARATPAS